METSKRKFFTTNKIILTVVIVLLAIGIFSFSRSFIGGSTTTPSKVALQNAKSSQTLNKEFNFPIKDEAGKEVTKIKYTVENAELRDQIVVQGKTATAVKGRTFLIFSIKLGNDYDKAIKINTGDFTRLSVNGNQDQWFAPDIHNDPVTVQAASTKNTRVGFAINESDKDLKFRVGEITGAKTILDIKF